MPVHPRKALVTGCAGFIGSHLTEALLADGVEVVGVDCFNDNYARHNKRENLHHAQQWDAFDFVPVDLARGDLAELMAECDVVYHLAAEPGVRSSWGQRFETYLRNNLHATHLLLEAARTVGVEKFVYASSSSIYGQAETLPTHEDIVPAPFSPYGVTKLAAEHMCNLYWTNHGVHATSLRFFTVYGPRQRPDMAFTRFCRAAVEGSQITIYGDGEQTRDFTFVSDVVAAVRLAGASDRSSGRVYNIGGGSRISVNAALETIAQFAGRDLDVEYESSQAGDVRDTGADTTRARGEIGWLPQVSPQDGLLQQFEWARDTSRSLT